MPKATFNNLPPEKNSCAKRFAEDFSDKPISQVKVSEIVEALQMSREFL